MITSFTTSTVDECRGSDSIHHHHLMKSTLLFTLFFDKKLYGERLRKELNLSHLPKHVQTLVQDLIIKYWSVFFWQRPFCSRGRLWIIDTGTARPISVSKIHLILSSDSVSTLSYWMLWQGSLPTQYRVATMLSKSPSVMDCYGGYLMPLMVTIKFVSLNVQRRS